MTINQSADTKLKTWMAIVEFEVCDIESPLDFSKPGGFSNVVGVAVSENDFLDEVSLTFKELRSKILEIDDIEILGLRDDLSGVDPDILDSISLLSVDNKVEIATIDYYLERADH